MDMVCPSCGAGEQQAGKYCENCGYLIPVDGGSPAVATAPPVVATAPPPWGVSLRFALVLDGAPRADEGFTVNSVGEFLLGRLDQDTGNTVDVDLRRWVQPLDIDGQKQYLVHRRQCYIGLGADGAATIRACPGAEADTLVKGTTDLRFTALENLDMLRQARPDGSFALAPGDLIFLGDPNAAPFFLAHEPTARGSYAVFQLLSTTA